MIYDQSNADYPFKVYVEGIPDILWENCELAEDVEEISYLKIINEEKRYCDKFDSDCIGCKYANEDDCRDKWFADNFNITRKVQNENN